jgi:hypothetical protein
MGVFDSGDEVHHPLQTEPEGLHAGLAIAVAPGESGQASDQANNVVVKARGRLGQRRPREDLGGLDLVGIQQQLGIQIGQHPP